MNRNKYFKKILSLLLTLILMSCGGNSGGNINSVTLRNQGMALTEPDLLEKIKSNHLYCPGENIAGQLILENRFESVSITDINLVNDHVTNLMWQHDEGATRYDWREATAYLDKANEEQYAGFDNWRIPTVEELVSLLTPDKNGEYYIDPIFKKDILNTWTADEVEGATMGAWFVDFFEGKIVDGNRAAGLGHVRLVRSR